MYFLFKYVIIALIFKGDYYEYCRDKKTKKNNNEIFGYVGRCLETGKIKYFYKKNNMLCEFDINNVSDSFLYSCIKESRYERPEFSHK